MKFIRHFRHKKDDNHNEIVAACQRAGLWVEDIHNGELADILIFRCDRVYIFEIKAPGKRNRLTPGQIEKRKVLAKHIHVVETVEEIFKIVGLK